MDFAKNLEALAMMQSRIQAEAHAAILPEAIRRGCTVAEVLRSNAAADRAGADRLLAAHRASQALASEILRQRRR
jgi:hypothetical protein